MRTFLTTIFVTAVVAGSIFSWVSAAAVPHREEIMVRHLLQESHEKTQKDDKKKEDNKKNDPGKKKGRPKKEGPSDYPGPGRGNLH